MTRMLHHRRLTCNVNAVLQLPTDVFQSPDVQQLFQEVQCYQQQFVQLHKASTANQPEGEDPTALKARLLQLDNQKQQLKDKVSRAKTKVQTVPNVQSLQVVVIICVRSSCIRLQQAMTIFLPVLLHMHAVGHSDASAVHYLCETSHAAEMLQSGMCHTCMVQKANAMYSS